MEGVDYHFVDRESFERMEAEGAFLETAEVFGNRYGTPRRWVEEQLARGRLVILEIDVRGAKQVKAAMPDAFCVFIEPPSETALLERLRARRREDDETIRRRFAEAQREIAEAHASDAYSVYLVNDDLEEAIERAVGLVREEWIRRGGNPGEPLA